MKRSRPTNRRGWPRMKTEQNERQVCQRSLQETAFLRREIMLWTLFVILVILWLLGMVTSYTAGGLIHILLVVAIVVVLLRVFSGRRTV